jgi:hypothetical protein
MKNDDLSPASDSPTSDPPKNGQALQSLRALTASSATVLGVSFDPLGLFKDAVPEGLKVLHVAPSQPEADLVRQVLIESGFHVEYVSSTGGGAFGVMGSNVVYVQEADYDAALAFLQEYLNPAEGEASDERPEGGAPTD